MNCIGNPNRLTRLGEDNQAIKEYYALVQNKPLYSYYENLGWALERQGRTREAIITYQKAYRLFPGAARATSALLRYQQYLVKGNRLECTVTNYEKAQHFKQSNEQGAATRELSEEEVRLIEGTNFNGQELEKNYAQSSLATIEDTFALIRIIGNDLPPRHENGQSLLNVEYILTHEPELFNCTKLWLVNRIFDKETRAAIIGLLKSFNSEFIEIPFKQDKYIDSQWDFDLYPQMDFLATELYMKLRWDIKMRAEIAAYRNKNLYLMNNNGARNRALHEGRKRAKWVLPWDGNCIVSEQAWEEIVSGVASRPYLKYFAVPMQRLVVNSDFSNHKIPIQPKDEPQVIFRRDASECFCTNSPYGRRPKVRLFWKLGITGVWDNWKDDPWDLKRPQAAKEFGEYGVTGFTFRLASAVTSSFLEADHQTGTSGRKTRHQTRMIAIREMIHNVERSLALTSPHVQMGYYSPRAIGIARRISPGPGYSTVGPLLTRIIQNANAIVLARPIQANRQEDRANGFLGDLGRRGNTSCHGSSTWSVSAQIVPLVLAWKLDRDPSYVRTAARLLKAWLPLNDLVGRSDKGMVRLSTMTGLDSLLAAVELMNDAEEFDAATKASINSRLFDLVELIHSQEPRSMECLNANHLGTYHDLNKSALYSYLGNFSGLMDVYIRLQSRILGQIDAEGKQNNELIGTQSQHYAFKNLLGLMNAFRILAGGGAPRLNAKSEPAIRLRRALDWILAQDLFEWPFLQSQPHDPDLIWPLICSALDLGLIADDELPISAGSIANAFLKDSYGESTGVPPYWNFSLIPYLHGLSEDSDITEEIT